MKEKATTPILKVINVIITILFVFGNQMSAVAAFADSSDADKQEKKLTFKDQQQKVATDLIKGEQYIFDLTTELRPGKNRLAFSADKFSIAEFKQAPLPERVSLVGDKKQGYTLNLNADEKQQVHLYLQVTAAGLMDKQELTLKVQQEKFEFGEISIVKKQTAANDTDAQNDISEVTTTEDALSAGSDDSNVNNSTNNTTVKKSESRNDKESSQAKEDRKNSSIKATSKDQTTVKSQNNGGTSKQNKTPKNSSSDNAKSESSDDDADGDSDDGADIEKLKSNLSPRAETGTDVSEMLNGKSFFSQIQLQIGSGTPYIINSGDQLPANIKDGSKFALTYDFKVNDINEKIKDSKPEGLKKGDSYSFTIKGLSNINNGNGDLSGDLVGKNPLGVDEIFGTYKIEETADGNDAKVTFTFTNSGPLEGDGEFQFGIEGKYPGSGPVSVEYREDYEFELKVNEGTKLIAKSGKFSTTEANVIDWTIDVKANGSLTDLTLIDTPLNDTHELFNEEMAILINGDSRLDKSHYNLDLRTGKITFSQDVKITKISIVLKTKVTNFDVTKYWNKIEAQMGDSNIGSVEASVERTNTGTTKKLDVVGGKYQWTVKLATFKLSEADLKKLNFKDTMLGTKNPTIKTIEASNFENFNPSEDVTSLFTTTSSGDNITGAVKNDADVTALKNKYLRIIYTSEISNSTSDKNIDNIKNEFKWYVNNTEKGDANTSKTYSGIDKTTAAHDVKKQTIDWNIVANRQKWTFTENYVLTDTLPVGMDFAKDGTSYDLNQIIINDKTLTALIADNTSGITENSFEFKKVDEKNTFTINLPSSKYSGQQINVKVNKTTYDYNLITNQKLRNWANYEVNNYAGGDYEDVTLPNKIFKDAYKDAKLNLNTDDTPLTGNVAWTIGFNTRELTTFNKGNEVSFTDTLNQDGVNYLSFLNENPEQAGYELYEITRTNDENNNDKIVIAEEKVSADKYELVTTEAGHGKYAQTFKIRFKEDMGNKAFALKFKTPIDFDAWVKAEIAQPSKEEYHNKAVVNYNGKDMNVKASTSMQMQDYYMQKTGKDQGDGTIKWNGYINISAKDLSNYSNLKITDTPTGGHHLMLNDASGNMAFKLYEAKVTGYKSDGTPELTKTNKMLVDNITDPNDYDYKIDMIGNNAEGFTLTFANGYKVNKPLYIEYLTKIDNSSSNKIQNKLSLTAEDYEVNTESELSVHTSGIYYSYEVLIKKYDQQTNKPLVGAEFKLQEKDADGNWQDTKNMANLDQVGTTSSSGILQFNLLNRSKTYRVIETKAPDGYHGNYTSPEFSYRDKDKGLHVMNIPNTNNPEVGALKLHKTTKGESTNKQFSFKVEAMNGEEIDDSINGSFNIAYSDGTTNKIKFTNGTSDVIKLQATESATLTDLFITNPLTQKTIDYKVTETDSQGYQTEISVNGDEPILSNERDGIQLSEAERTVVDIINSNHLGDLVVRKQVTGPTADKDQVFKFNVLVSGEQATKVAGKTFTAKILNADDQTVRDQDVTFKPDADAEGNFRLTETFKLKDGQRMFISELPQALNARALEVKAADDPYETTATPATGSETTDEGYLSGHVEINEAVDRLIDFTNHLPSGTFQLSKQVVGAATDKDFTFELTTDKLTGEVKGQLIKSNGDSEATTVTFDDQGKATVTLKNNERLILSGLAVGTTIQVTETADAQYHTSSQLNNQALQSGLSSDTATVKDDDTQAITFYNQDHTGAFLVEKQVTNLPTHEAKEEFTFKVNFDGDVDNTFQLTILENGKKISSTDVSATDNQLEFKLKDGQQALISGLKIGTKATVVETTNADYQTSHRKVAANDWIAGHQTEALTVQEDELDGFQFRNEFLTADFKLTKTVSAQSDKASIDPDGKYRFDIYLLKNDTSGLTEANLDDYLLSDFHQYDYDLLEDGHKVTEGVLTVNNGHTTTVLKKDQTIHIKNLKQGQKVMAKEQNSDTYQATYQVKGSETSDTAPVITLDEAQEVLVNNQYLDQPKVHTLTIDKTVTGSTTKEAFEFKLKLFENHTEPYVTPITASKNHNPFINLEANEQNEYTFKLSNQDTITFKLPAGISYQVVESTQDERFTTEVEGNNVKRAGNKLSGELALTSDNTQSVHFYNQFGIEPPEEEGITPPDTDDTGTPPTSGTTTTTGSDTGKKGGLGFLPQTGEGRAYFLLTVLGLMILAVSGYYLYRKKRS